MVIQGNQLSTLCDFIKNKPISGCLTAGIYIAPVNDSKHFIDC